MNTSDVVVASMWAFIVIGLFLGSVLVIASVLVR